MRASVLFHPFDLRLPSRSLWPGLFRCSPVPSTAPLARLFRPVVRALHAVVHGDVAAGAQHGAARRGAGVLSLRPAGPDAGVDVHQAAPAVCGACGVGGSAEESRLGTLCKSGQRNARCADQHPRKSHYRSANLIVQAAHGALMFTSWFNVAGRLFGSNQSGDFTCHTYPVYKQLDSPRFKGANASLTYVPIEDPAYRELPWAFSLVGWSLCLGLLPLVAAFGFGWVYSLCCGGRSRTGGEVGRIIRVPIEHFDFQ